MTYSTISLVMVIDLSEYMLIRSNIAELNLVSSVLSWGGGLGVGGWGWKDQVKVPEVMTSFPPAALSFHTFTGSLDPFY